MARIRKPTASKAHVDHLNRITSQARGRQLTLAAFSLDKACTVYYIRVCYVNNMENEMTKVVYNACYGGFSLSREGVLHGRQISNDPKWGGPCIKGDEYNGGVFPADYGCVEVERTDPTLVRVVEELGIKASGDCAKLRVGNVAEGSRYRIDEYDGFESIMTDDSYDWSVA